MKGFIKILVAFIYLILALFIKPGDVFACHYIGQNSFAQCYISTTKSEINFVNDEKEKYFVISKNNNRTEISNLSNKNQNFNFGNLDKANTDFIISNNYIIDNSTFTNCISHNISPNLKNAIYTRAP